MTRRVRHYTVPSLGGMTTTLSPTQFEIIRANASLLSEDQVAKQRGRSPHTVRNQLQKIYRKLGVHSRGEAIRALDSEVPGWR